MFFKMNRTQTGDCGTLHADVIYDASKDQKLAKEARGYIERGFAKELTKKEIAALSKGDEADAKAAAEAEAKAAEEAAAKAQAEADAKAAEEAAADEKAKAAKDAADAKGAAKS